MTISLYRIRPYLDHLTGYLVSENLDSVPKLLKISQLAHVIPLNINTIKNEMFQNIKVELLKNFTVCVCVCMCLCDERYFC